MIESWEIDNRSGLIDYLRHYRYDRFDILDMCLSNELPDFISSEDDAMSLADEVLGTTYDEDLENADRD